MVINILLVVAAYLLGSIPSSIWIGKRFYNIDVREYGSHNAGATNTLRVLGPRAALPVFVIDFAKGYCAVMLWHFSSYAYGGGDPLLNFKIVLTVAAVLGHIFPVFAGFDGGKGVATLSGAVLAVYPTAVALCFAAWLILFVTTHYVSLSSIMAGILFPIFVIFLFNEKSLTAIIFSCIIAVLLILTHRPNIRRLLKGTESKTYIFKSKKRVDGITYDDSED